MDFKEQDYFEMRFYFSFKRVHLQLLVGEHANDYPQIAAKDKLTELQLRMRQLLDQVDQITKEQSYQRVSSFGITSIRIPF